MHISMCEYFKHVGKDSLSYFQAVLADSNCGYETAIASFRGSHVFWEGLGFMCRFMIRFMIRFTFRLLAT
jgi:hypothetical protein